MTTNKTKIDNYVTAIVAKAWDANPEKTMFFVEVLADLDIDLTLRDNPDQFDFLQNHFEDMVEAILDYLVKKNDRDLGVRDQGDFDQEFYDHYGIDPHDLEA